MLFSDSVVDILLCKCVPDSGVHAEIDSALYPTPPPFQGSEHAVKNVKDFFHGPFTRNPLCWYRDYDDWNQGKEAKEDDYECTRVMPDETGVVAPTTWAVIFTVEFHKDRGRSPLAQKAL